MLSFIVSLTALLITIPGFTPIPQEPTSSNSVSSIRQVGSKVPNKPESSREVVLEVPGISCVSRFTDSLRDRIVNQTNGVNGVAFEYLPRDQMHPYDDEIKKAIAEGKMFFGGWGRLTFQVDADFDEKILLRKLLKSKLYTNTEMWLVIQRKPLSKLELEK